MANASQEIVITALPAGYVAPGKKRLRITLHFSPRLVSKPGKETLDNFPDWLDWPQTVNGIAPTLKLNTGQSIPLEPSFGDDAPSSELWKRLFAPDTYVRPFNYTKLSQRKLRSYSIAQITNRISQIYGSLISDPSGEIPHANTIQPLYSDLQRIDQPDTFQRREKILGTLYGTGESGELRRTKELAKAFSSQDELEFFLARRFYKRPKNAANNPYRERPDPNYIKPVLPIPKLDFHQGIAGVSDFPRLLRLLGLALDFEFDIPKSFPTSGRLSIEPNFQPPYPQSPDHIDRKPTRTAYRLTKTFFGPQSPKGSLFLDGFLDLRGTSDLPSFDKPRPFQLSQVDIDGAAMKTLDFARAVSQRSRLANYRTPEHWAAPSLRTTGISVAQNRRDQTIAKSLQASDKLNTDFSSGATVTLHADDVLRGYRVDILDLSDENPTWRSLCLRQGRYTFEAGGAPLHLDLDDEGYVKSASASGESNGSTDLYLHERMFSFEGWSLVTPRPGKTLAKDPSDNPDENVTIPKNESADLPLSTHFRPQRGTLPKLRFGHKYRLRARLVDIAGNSLPLSDANETYVSEVIEYKRFEPVISPTVMPRTFYGEGESLEHMVIRSDYDRTPTTYANDPEVIAALADWPHQYAYCNERHIAPPKTSQQEAELHGMFDGYIGQGNDPQKGFYLASRESGNFFNTDIVNLDTGETEPLPDADLKLFTPQGTVPTDLSTHQLGDPLKEGEYIVRAEKQLITPYLPDPLAHGVALRNLPGDPDGLHLVEFGGDWPDVTPFRIRIVERPGLLHECEQVFPQQHEPKWDPESRLLTVFLPKGEVATVRYSCYVTPELSHFVGMTKWSTLSAANQSELEDRILSGGHWMTTPWRELTLVHATQRPLCAPRWKKLSQSRPRKGITYAYLRGTAHLNAPTTGQIDLQARWNEAVDDITQPSPSSIPNQSHVKQLTIDRNQPNLSNLPAPGPGKKPEPIIHEFGDTKHRVIRYWLKGTTRFREYLPPEINKFDQKISREGQITVLSIPSTARPLEPKIVDVLPAFEWSEARLQGGGVRRTRKGNTLRVYLDRPWYSSGEGELLGVVYNTNAKAQKKKPELSQWGKDPLFAGAAPSKKIDLSRFPLKVAGGTGLSLPETEDQQRVYGVAGHQVHYDKDRKLWYADIEVDAGASYFPMIRLALSRYQPSSIPDAHLSSVARTEFAQLVPDRTATLQPISKTRHALRLYGVAPTETHLSKNVGKNPAIDNSPAMQAGDSAVKPFKKPGLNRYEVRVEYLPLKASPDFGWKTLPGTTLLRPRRKIVPTPKRLKPAQTAQLKKSLKNLRFKRILSANTSFNIGEVSRKPKLERIEDVVKTVLSTPLWAADIDIPAAPPGAKRRIVIEEYELHLHEAEKLNPSEREQSVEKRLVYADILPV